MIHRSLSYLFCMAAISVTALGLTTTAAYAQGEVAAADDDSPLETSATLAVDSRYVAEGRDDCDSKPLYNTTLELSYGEFSFETWYGISPGARYDELSLSLTYTKEWNDFEAYVSASYLEYFKDREHDHEFVAGLAYSGLPAELTAGIEAYYSFNAWGAFAETYLSGDYEVHERLNLHPTAILGWNLGYVPDGHQGVNHFALGLEASTPLTDNFTFSLSVTRYWSLDRNARRYADDASLRDCFVFGAALNATF